MMTFKKYHNMYLTTDVLLLAHVFQQFKRLVKGEYDLDSSQCHTTPGFSRGAMWKMTTTASCDDKTVGLNHQR